MEDLLLHPQTYASLTFFLSGNAHAVLLVGPYGSGKTTTADAIAADALHISKSKLSGYPYFRKISPEKGIISIDTIRELRKFLQLKTTGSKPRRRIVIIEGADTMPVEAQNALLKTLEEPPEDTLLILTTQNSTELRQTILSRLQKIELLPVSKTAAIDFFKQAHDSKEIEKSYTLSAGYIGLMSAILKNKEDHELLLAIESMKNLLGTSSYGRLLRVDELAKNKDFLPMLLRACSLIAGAALSVAIEKGNNTNTHRWRQTYQAAYEAEAALRHNPNTKLLLTNLMLVV